MRLIKILYFLLPFIGMSQAHTSEGKLMNKLFVCYGKVNPELVKGYTLVIIESEHYSSSEIAVFNKNNKKVVAYLSLSEVNKYASFYKDIAPYILEENNIWNSYLIDIQNKKAQQVLITVINRMKQKGVQGLFLDNLDNVSKWGKLHKQKGAFLNFLENIRKNNKNLFLVQNAGLFITKELKTITDAIVVESVVSSYDFNTKTYKLRDSKTKKEFIKNIKLSREIVAKPIYVIEYAETLEMKNSITREIKKLGFSSFVGQIELQSIPNFKKW